MLNVILFMLCLPALLLWSVFKLVEDIGRFFGFWLFPAVLALYFGACLFVAGPSAPDAVYETLFQWLSGYVILGIRLL